MIGDDSLRNKDEWTSRVSHEAELTLLRNQVAQWRSLYETAQRMVEMQNNQAARELALSHAAGQEAVAWITPCDLDAVIDCDDDRGFVTRLFGVTGEQLIPLYITPAATTNPAEIGRKSVGAGQESEPESYWIGIVRRYRNPLQRFIRLHAQFEYDRDRHKNQPRSAEDWAAVQVERALSGHLTTAKPPASAEAVAVDDAMLAFVADQLAGQLGEDSGHVETLLRKAFGLQAALAPIAGVTHGTDEGGGDE